MPARGGLWCRTGLGDMGAAQCASQLGSAGEAGGGNHTPRAMRIAIGPSAPRYHRGLATTQWHPGLACPPPVSIAARVRTHVPRVRVCPPVATRLPAALAHQLHDPEDPTPYAAMRCARERQGVAPAC
jgi:hypothetical protein